MTSRPSQTKAPLRLKEITILIGGAVSFLMILFAAVIFIGNNPVSLYLKDPAATFGFTPLAGLVSHLGAFALLTAGVIGIFTSCHVHPGTGLLFWVGVFSLMIGADDVFMIHESLAPRYGIGERYVFAFYGLLALTILVVFRNSLIGASHIGLYTAIVLLGASVLADVTMVYSGTQVVFEDSLKFLGLIVWSGYWVRRAHLVLSEALSPDE